MPYCTVPEALEELRQGRMLIVVESGPRGDEGNLVMAAEKVTPEAINFMATMGRGLVCLALTAERAQQLDLPLMASPPGDRRGDAFTLSLDARVGVTSGVSAYERAYTIQRAVDPAAGAADFVRPGHVFPLRARDGGVREQPAPAEAAVDLARLAGLRPAGVICAVIKEDGTLAREPDLVLYARRHGLRICRIAELAAYLARHVRLPLSSRAAINLPTRHGHFRLLPYEDRLTGEVHLALVRGEVAGALPVPVYVHFECTAGEALASLCCDCGPRLDAALAMIQAAGSGVAVYLRRRFRAEHRDYGPAAHILQDLGVQRLRLLSDSAEEAAALAELGLPAAERLPVRLRSRQPALRYVTVERDGLGHCLTEGEV